MENVNNQNLQDQHPKNNLSNEVMILEILENSRKTKKYMQWQFYITIALVVLPILAMLILLPIVLNSLQGLGSAYMGVLQ